MQEAKKTLAPLFYIISIVSGCSYQADHGVFDTKVAEYKNSLVDQVNESGKGLPFFTEKTLNPTWDTSGKTSIVQVPEFHLFGQDGKPRDQSLFQGKISVVAFIFTSCAAFCPFLTTNLKKVDAKLKDFSNIQFIEFTVDPEIDSATRLAEYAKKYQLDTKNKRWTLLTGERKTIYDLAHNTLITQAFQKPDPKMRNFIHSEHFYVLDEKGRLRAILNGTRIDVPESAKEVVTQLGDPQQKFAQSEN